MKPRASANLYGFQLGAAYKDAIDGAGKGFKLQEDGPQDHRGTGTLDGMQASITLAGKNGHLVDVHLQLQLATADKDLASSKPFARLQSDLGKPADTSADVASWKPTGFNINLQRQSTWARGEDQAKIEYTIRGRMTADPASSGSSSDGEARDAEQQDAKDREAEKGAP